ncbi:MAG: dipeptide/oligopeptide/nickel ABC transporter ATP-binding protein [Spirochaetaceae bacterium]|nr:dipeptide/oligopeptide/nickel ABC transporter ATP-binding protein [Spirochaetaceae bacterium]
MLSVENVRKTYHKGGLFSRKTTAVLKDVSFDMRRGECLGIIGESGSGKSTLSRLILGIEKPSSGQVLYDGRNVMDPAVRRGKVSAVFQDYTSSFNPNYTVYEAIIEPLIMMERRTRSSLSARAVSLLTQVGLDGSYLEKYPHELSGGEAQRVCIARAVSTTPELLVLDEVVSSIDVSIQVQILDLFYALKNEMDMSYIFITHDIQAAAYLCDRVLFFYDGSIVEESPVTELYNVRNEYAKKLLGSVILA